MNSKSLYVISDLMFRSRVRETVKSSPIFSKSLDESISKIENEQIDEVFVDLNLKNDSIEIIKSLRLKFPNLNIIAFGSHMDTEKLSAAEAAGASEVLANSGMVKLLESKRS